MNTKTILFAFCIILASCQPNTKTEQAALNNSLPTWALGEFVRPAVGNPVITPIETTVFECPMYKKKIAWQSNDTFNPAAVVMNDQIYVLYKR